MGEMLGGCSCGSVRYAMAGPPLFVHCCHCTTCQTETGSAFAINALIETTRISLAAGAPVPVDTPSESGLGQTIMRCRDCHVALWSHYAGGGKAIAFLRVGTLDTPGAVEPDIHIYTRSKLPWVMIPEHVRAVDAYYDTAAIWPTESLARGRAVRG